MYGTHKLGSFDLPNENLKGALLFSKNLREKVAPELGFPIYAVIPVRDFCLFFGEKDFDFFIDKIGTTVGREFRESGYPVTLEILKFSENGCQAVGAYQ